MMEYFAKKKKGGFTLIELLVVIAIIGILTGIVLVSVTSAKAKAKDTRVIVDISQIRNIAALVSGDTGSYADLCDAGKLRTSGSQHAYTADVAKIAADIKDQNGALADATCYAGSASSCVSSVLNVKKAGALQYYCIDATGISTTTSPTNPCDSVNGDC